MIAAWKIGPPDRSLEQYVSDERKLGRLVKKNDMTRCVARTVDDVEYQLAYRYLIAVMQPAVWGEWPAGDAIFAVTELVDPELVILLRPLDRYAQFFREDARAAAMVDMAMGDEQLFDRHALFGGSALEHVEIAARIYERAAHCFRTPQQGAVLLERRHREDNGLDRGLFCHGERHCRAIAAYATGIGRENLARGRRDDAPENRAVRAAGRCPPVGRSACATL